MLNLLVSLAAAVATALLAQQLPGHNPWFSGVISLVVLIAVFFYITRRITQQISGLSEKAQADVAANRLEKGLLTLKGGYKYAKWQFFARAQIDSQIGCLLFIKREFKEAFPYLQRAFVRNWVAMGMLGVCYMKRQQAGKMIETFEKAVAASKKEALLWNLYAFCLDKIGEHAKAVEVMERGLKKCGDSRLADNLEALKTGQKMKMKGYGDAWYQFHLEKMGTIIRQQTKALTGRRKQQVR